jgi:thiol:disulfide interchange protein DsbA
MLRLLFAVLSLTVMPLALAQAPLKYTAGRDYFVVQPAQPTDAPAGKIEVMEVFSYACIHCAHFEPMVATWKKKAPANVHFTYMPAAWSPPWEMVARAFYAAEALGVLEKTHSAFFDALHVAHVPIQTMDDVAKWYSQSAGVDPAQFLQVANSFAVNAKIQRSKQSMPRFGVDGTPTLIVAGKYRITGQSAGGLEKMFDVADFLVQQESAPK